MTKSAENKKFLLAPKASKTIAKHRRLRNIKAIMLDRDFIRKAIKNALENKKPTKELTWIKYHTEEVIDRIHRELKEETYVPKPYRFRTIMNDNGKKRHLAILGIYDRCVQQVLKNAIQWKLRGIEPRNVYSSLPTRGTLSNNSTYCLYNQLRHGSHVCRDGYGLKIDIHHCYESISREVVMREVFEVVTDAWARRLIKRMYTHIDYLPIGDPLSGLYVNLVLRKWHMHCLEDKHYLFDYCYFFCDDALFFNRDSKDSLHELCKDAREFLLDFAGLHVKKNYQIYRIKDGITFCGVKVFPDKLLVKQATKKKMFKNKNNLPSLASYKGILDKTSSGHLSQVLEINTLSERIKNTNAYGRRYRKRGKVLSRSKRRA